MQTITRKPIVKELIEDCLREYSISELMGLCNAVENQLLSNKIKFPLLEYAAHLLFNTLQQKDQIPFCNEIEKLKSIGGHVLIGIILQNRLTTNPEESFTKAAEYISKTNTWHICDTVGERVFGYSLLHQPKTSFPKFQELANHKSFWVVRSLGAGAHYAIKKGLTKEYVIRLFQLLLSLANSRQKEIKQGIGWAAKTTAKFHPDVIEDFRKEIEDTEKVGQWFRGKIKIGLNRNLYAQRNRS